MQANREICFQKNCSKTARIGEAFIQVFIIDAAEKESGRISLLADTNVS